MAAILAVSPTFAPPAEAAVTTGEPEAGHHKAGKHHRAPALIIRKIHRARNMTWHYQRLMGKSLTPYHHYAEHTTSLAFRRWILSEWKHHRRHAHHAYLRYQRAGSVPASFYSAMSCISLHEEYGMDGPNTVAGYFGFVYPPSGYIAPGPQMARTYGNSWLSIPLGAQLQVAYALYRHYGWSPWSTAPGCGLA